MAEHSRLSEVDAGLVNKASSISGQCSHQYPGDTCISASAAPANWLLRNLSRQRHHVIAYVIQSAQRGVVLGFDRAGEAWAMEHMLEHRRERHRPFL